MAEVEREFGWDDIIENDSADFIVLPEGDYDFEITGFERQRHQGSEKLPPCNKAAVSVAIKAPQGTVTIRHNLFLHSKCEGLLCAFFVAIGQRKHGEKLQMNWNRVIGATGRCKVGVRNFTKKDGETGYSNEIKRFYEPEEAAAPAAPAAAPAFIPGSF